MALEKGQVSINRWSRTWKDMFTINPLPRCSPAMTGSIRATISRASACRPGRWTVCAFKDSSTVGSLLAVQLS